MSKKHYYRDTRILQAAVEDDPELSEISMQLLRSFEARNGKGLGDRGAAEVIWRIGILINKRLPARPYETAQQYRRQAEALAEKKNE